MKIEVKQQDAKATVSATADESALTPIVRSAFNELRSNVEAKGFRKGRAPNEVVERELGSERVQSEIVEAAAQAAYRQAVSEHDLHPIDAPHVELKKFVPYTRLELVITVGVMPEIKLADYKKFSVPSQPASVADADVERVVEGLRLRAAKRREVKRSAAEGDEAIIDFEGQRDGVTVPGASGADYPAVIGSGRLVDGFEEELIGLKAGDKKEFKLTFPQNYAEPSLAGQPVTFSVTVKKINQLDLPAVDDAFASEVGPFKDLAQLKDDIKKNLKTEKEQESQRQTENEVVKNVVENSQLKIPSQLVETQSAQLRDELDRQLAARGSTREQYLKTENKTEADLDRELEGESERRLKTAMVLTEVAKAEGLKVTPEETQMRLQMLKGQYPDEKMQAELDKPEARREISNQLLAEKTVAKLVEYAK